MTNQLLDMANYKHGLKYYTVDTDRYQDRRIKQLKCAMRCQGIAVYDYILCEIYRVRGCYTEWDDETAFDVAEYFGLKESAVREIVKYCGSVGLFDKALLSRGIITSAAIQQRYLDMCSRARRVGFGIPDFCKLTEECAKLTEECAKPPEESPQSKVKKSKVKKPLSLTLSPLGSRDESEPMPPAVADEKERERILIHFFFEKKFANPSEEVERYCSHYDGVGWKDAKMRPILDKVTYASGWQEKVENRAQKRRFPQDFYDKWRVLYDDVVRRGNREAAKALLTDVYAAQYSGEKTRLTITMSPRVRQLMDANKDYFTRFFAKFFPNVEVRVTTTEN